MFFKKIIFFCLFFFSSFADAGYFEPNRTGIYTKSDDKNYAFTLKGAFQVDQRHFINDSGDDDFLGRRLRPDLRLKVHDLLIRYVPDFAGGNVKTLDFYADYPLHEQVFVRAGKYQPPLNIERIQSSSDIYFAERGHTNHLAPSRDIGVSLYITPIKDILEYQIGIFYGSPDTVSTHEDDDTHQDIVARIFTTPFKTQKDSDLKGLGFGMAGTYGRREATPSETLLRGYRSVGQQRFFRYRTSSLQPSQNVYADGVQWRFFPQGYFYKGSFGFLTEYGFSHQTVRRQDMTSGLLNTGWNITMGYVLTGEESCFNKTIQPFSPIEWNKQGFGAWEAMARIGGQEIDKDAFPTYANISQSAQQADSWGVGMNWYLNQNLKFIMTYDHTNFKGGAIGGQNRPEEEVLINRFQLRF